MQGLGTGRIRCWLDLLLVPAGLNLAVQLVEDRTIIALGADEDLATKIVLAIVAGEIPAVSMAF